MNKITIITLAAAACKLHASKNVSENAENPQNPPIS